MSVRTDITEANKLATFLAEEKQYKIEKVN